MNLNKLKQWLWRNKKGAIIGGIIGPLLLVYIARLGGGNSSYFEDVIMIIKGIIDHEMFWQIGLIVLSFGIILGALIGAFIDSKWRPKK